MLGRDANRAAGVGGNAGIIEDDAVEFRDFSLASGIGLGVILDLNVGADLLGFSVRVQQPNILQCDIAISVEHESVFKVVNVAPHFAAGRPDNLRRGGFLRLSRFGRNNRQIFSRRNRYCFNKNVAAIWLNSKTVLDSVLAVIAACTALLRLPAPGGISLGTFEVSC